MHLSCLGTLIQSSLVAITFHHDLHSKWSFLIKNFISHTGVRFVGVITVNQSTNEDDERVDVDKMFENL